MRIVVTGGTGFIGRLLLDRLVGAGHNVFVLTRDTQRTRPHISQAVMLEHWDAKSQGYWTRSIDGADAVINLAGEPIPAKRWTPPQKEKIRSSRIDATRAVVEAIKKASRKPALLINASAVGYYGHATPGILTEDTPPGKGFLSEICREWEKEALRAEDLGARVVLLRLGVVLGEEGGALRRMLLPFRLFAGGPIGSGDQWFPWVHADDVVSIVMFSLGRTDLHGPLNVSAPHPVMMKEFCSILGEVLHRPSWLPVPPFAVRLLLGEMAIVVLGSQRQVPQRLLAAGFEFGYDDLRSALTSLLR